MKDRILFWLGADFTQFCISYGIQKECDSDLFAIVDITNKTKKFFLDQNLVSFNKIWFFHDNIKKPKSNPDVEYLKNFEKKYGIHLWQLAVNERIFYRFYNFYKFSTNEILSILEQECKFFEDVLNQTNPNFLVIKEPAFHHLELFRQLCKAKGVTILMLNQSFVGKQCLISEQARTFDLVNDFSQIKGVEQDFHKLQNYMESTAVSKQIKIFNKRHAKSKINLLKAFLRYLISNNSNVHNHYTYYGRTKLKVIFNMAELLVKKKIRQYFIDTNLEKTIDTTKQFVYYPMAVDLERNLLLDAPYYTNQIEVIRHIVKSLPPDHVLYIKENPSQDSREWRSISEYKKIMNIPNVVLFHPHIRASELLKHCKLVITISGTSAVEGAFHQKPAIVFGNVGSTIFPWVYKLKDMNELPNAIKSSLEYKVQSADLDKFLKLQEQNCFEFDLFEFAANFKDQFYYSGSLVDVEISISQMDSFLKENEILIEKLTREYLKKITLYKKFSNDT
jgi:hypothetical protein